LFLHHDQKKKPKNYNNNDRKKNQINKIPRIGEKLGAEGKKNQKNKR